MVRVVKTIRSRNVAATGHGAIAKAKTPSKGPASKSSSLALPSLALVSAICALFGWGVVAGALNRVSLPVGLLISSPGESLLLMWAGIAAAVEHLGGKTLWEISIEAVLQNPLPPILAGTLLALAVFVAKKFPRLVSSKRKWLARAYSPSKSAFLVWAAMTLFGYLAMAIVPALMIALLVVTLFVPLIGYTSGTEYVTKHVILPKSCAKVPDHADLVQKISNTQKRPHSDNSINVEPEVIFAECVLVSSIDQRKPFKKCGRVVLATSGLIVLYGRLEGAARIPLNDMSVTPSSVEEGAECETPILTEQKPGALRAPLLPKATTPTKPNRNTKRTTRSRAREECNGGVPPDAAIVRDAGGLIDPRSDETASTPAC